MTDRDQHESVQEQDAAEGQEYQQEELLKEEGEALIPDPQALGDEEFLPDMGEATSQSPDGSPESR